MGGNKDVWKNVFVTNAVWEDSDIKSLESLLLQAQHATQAEPASTQV